MNTLSDATQACKQEKKMEWQLRIENSRNRVIILSL